MPTIKIMCPWHGQDEEIKLPDDYFGPGQSSFVGDIPCGGPEKDGHVTPRRPILQVDLEFLANGTLRVRKLNLKQ